MNSDAGGRATDPPRAQFHSLLVWLALVLASALWTPHAFAATCLPALARLVSVQGTVELRRADSASWSPAAAEVELCAGDSVRVGDRSRAALRLANQSTLRLDQHTVLTLRSADQSLSLVNLLGGAIHVITRTPRPFNIRTPFVNAGVEGTEFLVRVATDSAEIVVVEGKVIASNDQGVVELADGASVLAERNRPPRLRQIVRPADAVQWALYYPAIIGLTSTDKQSLRDADDRARTGATDQAFAIMDAVPSPQRDARYHAWHADLLLRVGRVDEADRAIANALAANPRSSDALALNALIAVVRNDTVRALGLAREAVALDPASSAAQIALSYVAQSRFDIPAARASAEQAAALAPTDALAWARVAELRVAGGDLGGALAAAESASGLGAELARTHTVLGFVRLMRFETKQARQAFARAIELDQADHLPRLGLGLALVRDGGIAAGREAIEIAASLDPLNSLLRSYVGKAYFEEKRENLAASQFELARQFDPNDPTPWLYEAILRRSENKPVEALRALEKSIELNDRRAVYRSRQLLDQDLATRQVSLAAVFGELLAEREAVAIASRSLADDPANDSAHRFLSEAYSTRDRHDIARTSELLQARLLQPLSLNPVSPELPFVDLGLPGSIVESAVFSNDIGALFERDRVGASLGVLRGNLGTSGGRLQFSALGGPISGSIGLFDYSTDGFRPNSDIQHRISNVFLQYAAAPSLSLQAEYRNRHTRQGDLALTFDPGAFSRRQRATVDEHSIRVGGTFRPDPETVWLVSAVRSQRRDGQQFFVDGFVDGSLAFDDAASSLELQYQHKLANLSLVAGAGRTRVDSTAGVQLDYTPLGGGPCPLGLEPCSNLARTRLDQRNGYLYVHLNPTESLAATLGASRDHYSDGTVLIDRWSPKLGVRWAASPAVTLRVATFSTVKRALVAQQTIEPTQLVGFNQFYDDVNGTVSQLRVAAADWRASPSLSFGVERGHQGARTGTGTVGVAFASAPVQTLTTDWLRLDVSSRASSALVASVGLIAERFRWDATVPTDSPTNLMTTRVPVTLRSFMPGGYYGELMVTGVAQRVRRLPGSAVPVGDSRFVVADIALGYRLSSRLGTVSVAVKNLFGAKFSYQDDNFRSTESRAGPYLPVRRVWLNASLAF